MDRVRAGLVPLYSGVTFVVVVEVGIVSDWARVVVEHSGRASCKSAGIEMPKNR